MKAKAQVSVRLDALHLKLLEGLQPMYGSSKSEVARQLIVEGMEEKIGLEQLRAVAGQLCDLTDGAPKAG